MSPWPLSIILPHGSALTPQNEASGGKILKNLTRTVVSRLATVLRMAATTLRLSQSYLGAKFRRFGGKFGAPKAITHGRYVGPVDLPHAEMRPSLCRPGRDLL